MNMTSTEELGVVARTSTSAVVPLAAVLATVAVCAALQAGDANPSAGAADRDYTIGVLRRIADPVLIPLSENRLHREIPRRDWETRTDNVHTSPLQAFGRTLSGMAPWLALGADESAEGRLRARYIELARRGLIHGTDPEAPDYLFRKPTQERIVHAAFVAYPLLLAPAQLWEPLSAPQRAHVVAALQSHRAFKPGENNWLLFSALIECALWEFTGEYQRAPVEYAVKRHEEWYLGDGTYGDGREFHWDYYNSFVIQPFLLEVLRVCQRKGDPLGKMLPRARARAGRHAEVLEHLISPEGTFPIIGRSAVYRFAAFQLIGYLAFRQEWPASLQPGSTRAALTAVIRRMTDAPGTFDEQGWLHAGVVGHQPGARDAYNYTGALYMCAMGLLHLGLPPESDFWSQPAGPWFQQRVWSGALVPNQKALKN